MPKIKNSDNVSTLTNLSMKIPNKTGIISDGQILKILFQNLIIFKPSFL